MCIEVLSFSLSNAPDAVVISLLLLITEAAPLFSIVAMISVASGINIYPLLSRYPK